jgi:uncharacterized OsmC-like protein
MPASRINLSELQAPLRARYAAEPSSAPLTLRVRSGASDLADPLHCIVRPDTVPGVEWRSGAHPAVGGTGDVPCSGDLLLGALAACQEITIRMVAANLGFDVEALEVVVEGDWDPRGTLAMGREHPVGITAIRAHTRIVLRGEVGTDRAERLLRSAERYCVVLATLNGDIDATSTFELESIP